MLLIGCHTSPKNTKEIKESSAAIHEKTGPQSEKTKEKKNIESSAKTEPDSYLTLCAVGDNIIYNTLYWQAEKRTGKSGIYDFTPVYAHVKSYIKGHDVSLVNEESPLATAVAAPSSYPAFNAPTSVGDALVDAGFDVVGQANNHALDMGEKGLLATLNYWKTQPNISVIGATASPQDSYVAYYEKNGITLSFLAYTEMTNGRSLPQNSKAKIYYTGDIETMKKQIATAKEHSDFVVVMVHWGEEYTNKPNANQKKLAQQMADMGADLILGSHPHVIQPIDTVRAKDGRDVLVYYSLGNFVSHQKKVDTVLGGLADLTLQKKGDTGKVSVQTAKFVPLVMHGDAPNGKNLTVYYWSQYNKTLAAKHYLALSGFDYEDASQYFHNIISEKYLEIVG